MFIEETLDAFRTFIRTATGAGTKQQKEKTRNLGLMTLKSFNVTPVAL